MKKTEIVFVISGRKKISNKLNIELSNALNALVASQHKRAEEEGQEIFVSSFQDGNKVEWVPGAAASNVVIIHKGRSVGASYPSSPLSGFDLVAEAIAATQGRAEDRNVIFVVIADHKSTARDNRGISVLVESLEKKRWTFVFACFDPSAVDDGKEMGISPERIRFFAPNQHSVREFVSTLNTGISSIRADKLFLSLY